MMGLWLYVHGAQSLTLTMTVERMNGWGEFRCVFVCVCVCVCVFVCLKYSSSESCRIV